MFRNSDIIENIENVKKNFPDLYKKAHLRHEKNNKKHGLKDDQSGPSLNRLRSYILQENTKRKEAIKKKIER